MDINGTITLTKPIRVGATENDPGEEFVTIVVESKEGIKVVELTFKANHFQALGNPGILIPARIETDSATI